MIKTSGAITRPTQGFHPQVWGPSESGGSFFIGILASVSVREGETISISVHFQKQISKLY